VAALITLYPFTIYNTEPPRNGKQTGWQAQAIEGKQRHLENKDSRMLSHGRRQRKIKRKKMTKMLLSKRKRKQRQTR
jgi:hypothetical protein